MGKQGDQEARGSMTQIDLNCVVPIEQMRGDSEEDTRFLGEMRKEAEGFMNSFDWCRRISEEYFGFGVGKVIAVFLFKIVPRSPDIDKWLWVIVGDLPPAYLVTDNSPDPVSALESYISEMEKWVRAALNSQAVDHLIPVNVEPTDENATALAKRLSFLKKEILPNFGRAPLI
jgi:hypothetical protein